MRTSFSGITAAIVAGTIMGGTLVAVTSTTTMASGRDAAVSSTAARAEPAEAAGPRYSGVREVTLPAGTVLPLSLDSYVASDRNHVEDVVRAHLRRTVVVDGATILPAGSTVIGNVTSVARPGRVKGRGLIAFRFHGLTTPSGDRVAIRTSSVSRIAPATKRNDALKIGVPAAGGAIIGALTGGKKGSAIGAAAGGGAGTAVVLSTRGKDVRLGPGAAVAVRLLAPITVRVR